MKNLSYVHVGLVLDASGSMESLRKATVSSLKEFLGSLRSKDDKTLLDVWQFDDNVQHLVRGVDVNTAAPRVIEGYRTDGCTALHDAVCIAIDDLGARFAAMSESERPDAVIVAVLTDGFENASHLYTAEDVKSRIKHQSEKYSWTFRFLAANQDAVTAGAKFGFHQDDCLDFDASEKGMHESLKSISMCCCEAVRPMARMKRAARQSRENMI